MLSATEQSSLGNFKKQPECFPIFTGGKVWGVLGGGRAGKVRVRREENWEYVRLFGSVREGYDEGRS